MNEALTALVWVVAGAMGVWVAAMIAVVVIALVRIAKDK